MQAAMMYQTQYFIEMWIQITTFRPLKLQLKNDVISGGV